MFDPPVPRRSRSGAWRQVVRLLRERRLLPGDVTMAEPLLALAAHKTPGTIKGTTSDEDHIPTLGYPPKDDVPIPVPIPGYPPEDNVPTIPRRRSHKRIP